MKPLIVACVVWHSTGFPEALGKGVASRRFHTLSIGHPLQGATWQLVANSAVHYLPFPLGNSLIVNPCRNY
jgi:hypothetical protein